MAFNLPDFLGKSRINDYSGIANIFENYMRGQEIAERPQQLKNEREMNKSKLAQQLIAEQFAKPQAEQDLRKSELANRLAEIQARFAEPKAQSDLNYTQAQIDKMQREQSDPFGGHHLTGIAGEIFSDELIKKINPDLYQKVQERRELEKRDTESKINSRNLYSESIGQRSASTIGKLANERMKVLSGQNPYDRNAPPLTESEKDNLLNQYDMQMLKNVTDADTRKRALFATNIDKTLSKIDPNIIAKYSGVLGLGKESFDKVASQLDKSSEDYKKLERTRTALDFLAKQTRQFYGDSIQDAAVQRIVGMVNPASWGTSPEIALEKFNEMKNILNMETGTFRAALSGTDVYRGDNQGGQPTESDPLGLGL